MNNTLRAPLRKVVGECDHQFGTDHYRLMLSCGHSVHPDGARKSKRKRCLPCLLGHPKHIDSREKHENLKQLYEKRCDSGKHLICKICGGGFRHYIAKKLCCSDVCTKKYRANKLKAKGAARKAELHFVIEGKPVSQKNRKRIYINKGTGRQFIGSEQGVLDWKKSAIYQLRSQWHGKPPLEGDLNAVFYIHQGARQAVDLDNAISGAFDALQKSGVIKNDYQIASYSCSRHRDRERPRIVIQLEHMGDR